MIYRYCLKCKQILKRSLWVFHNQKWYCKHCGGRIVYFGREAVQLSPQSVLDDYDSVNAYNPLADYNSFYKNYLSQHPSESVLECEDVLTYRPNDIEPMMFLLRYNVANKNFLLAKKYAKNILLIDPYHLDALKVQLQIFFYEKDFEQALLNLNTQDQCVENKFDIYHQLGIVYLSLNQYENAITYFYRAFYCSENELTKKKIKFIIRKINSFID